MRVIILAAGDGQRWNNYLGVPKHLVPIHGEPLVHRTQRMLHERGISDVIVMAQTEWAPRYVLSPSQWGVPAPVERSWVQEMEPSRRFWSTDDRTLILYGDCYFTEDIMDALVADQASDWRVYARHDGSMLTGKEYGEMFGWVFRPEHHDELDRARVAAIEAVESGRWDRCLGWEVHRIACGQEPWHHDWSDPVHFVEWDDATDDFDYPRDWDTWAALNPDLAYVTGISICIPWRDSGSFERTRAKEFVVAHYSQVGQVILADSGHEEFNRSASRNVAAEMATTDVLVFTDADAYVPLDQIVTAADRARATGLLVKPFTHAGYLTEESSEALLTGATFDPEWIHPPTKGFVGLAWAIQRAPFARLSGFDPGFVGYGGEDNAFCAACDNLLGRTVLVPGIGYSLWHPAERTTSLVNVERVHRYYATTTWDAYRALRLET